MNDNYLDQNLRGVTLGMTKRSLDSLVTYRRVVDDVNTAQAKVDFAGFTISAEGYHIDKSIHGTGITDSKLSACTATVAGVLVPLQPILSTRNEFLWSPALLSLGHHHRSPPPHIYP